MRACGFVVIVGFLFATDVASASSAVAIHDEQKRVLCSGAFVSASSERIGILTAAHCLFRFDAEARAVEFRRHLDVEGIGRVETDSAVIAASFRACVASRVPYPRCLARGGKDIAFVPVSARPEGLKPMALRRVPGAGETTLLATGFGRGHRRSFELVVGHVDAGVSRARPGGSRPGAAEAGDSGAPVVTEEDDEVAFLVVAQGGWRRVGTEPLRETLVQRVDQELLRDELFAHTLLDGSRAADAAPR